jgi:membrane protease YdiL (CAAX protease family)
MVLISLFGWLAFSKIERLKLYEQIAFSFFSVSLGVLLARYLGGPLTNLFRFPLTTIQGVAMAKFSETLPIVLSILVLHFATGGDLDGIFLKGGNLKFSLIAAIFGVSIFLIIAVLQVMGSGLQWVTVASALPWILIFIFSNAFLEELWFRALFLKKLTPLIGVPITLIITSIVFAGVHISSTYVVDILMFVGLTFILGFIWAWLMNKSNSIWAPVFIHAAGDVLIMLGFLLSSNL